MPSAAQIHKMMMREQAELERKAARDIGSNREKAFKKRTKGGGEAWRAKKQGRRSGY